jgi:hypothetical protein
MTLAALEGERRESRCWIVITQLGIVELLYLAGISQNQEKDEWQFNTMNIKKKSALRSSFCNTSRSFKSPKAGQVHACFQRYEKFTYQRFISLPV